MAQGAFGSGHDNVQLWLQAGGCGAAPVDLEQWVQRARPESLSVTDTHVSIGASVAAFADQLALSKAR